jgi:hypothetical protein
VATGTYIDNSSDLELPLIEQWNGLSWSSGTVPAPAGAVAARLFDISCIGASWCMAVGEGLTDTTEVAFADEWNGTSWKLARIPGPDGLGSALGSVSCTAPNACTAVGAILDNDTETESTLAEAFNGTRWTAQKTADKAGKYDSYLYGVSCVAGGACMAVGGYNATTSSAEGALSDFYSGSRWHSEALPAPPNATDELPDPVSCSATDACIVVGSWATRRSGGAFAGQWNGEAWTAQELPSTLFDLAGVGCFGSASCVAVGGAGSGIWDGTSWTLEPLATPLLGLGASLDGIACGPGTACMAVGTAITGEPIPVAELYS